MADEPDRVELSSPDLAAESLKALEELFPGISADGVLDAARLGELVGLDVSGLREGPERYGLMWAGKHEAVQSLLRPSRGALIPDTESSVDFDEAENVFIEGDNLEVLKLMQKAYNDQVKLIYIDPPYNTGNDFVYNDDFSDGLRGYLEYTEQLDEEGNRTSASAETAGRRHSGWLSMIYPRLVLARNLLRQDGAILVSIDDNEAMNLKAVLDEVFGAENFIAQLVWAAGRKNDSKFVSVSHEYILVYARSAATLKEEVGKWRTRKEGLDEIYAQFNKLKRAHGEDYEEIEAELKAWYKALPQGNPSKRHKQYSRADFRGIYFASDIAWPGPGGPKYEVLHPATGKPVKIPSNGWRYKEERMREALAEDRIHFGTDESVVPCIKSYLEDRELEVPYSVFYVDGRGATKRLRTLLGGNYFENPKDETVLQRIVEFASAEDDLVLDFFAGSGSMAHAVALQNEADGGSRRCISVNLPEPTEEGSAAHDAGYETVSAITEARILAVMEEVDGAGERGLRIYELNESCFLTSDQATGEDLLSLTAETIRDGDVRDHDLAAEVLTKEGVRLDERWAWTKLAGADAVVAHGVAVVLARKVSDEIVEGALALKPRVLVFLEDGFAERDAAKANAYYACEQAGITMKTV